MRIRCPTIAQKHAKNVLIYQIEWLALTDWEEKNVLPIPIMAIDVMEYMRKE